MSPTDPTKLLAVDSDTAILVDRRSRHAEEAAAAAGLTVVTRWQIRNPVDDGIIHAAVLKPLGAKPGFEFPRQITTTTFTYTRLVDRFYLPDNPGPAVSSALFNIIAHDYDRLTHTEINLATANTLLEAVRMGRESDRLRVLDFGCGTGIAYTAGGEMTRAGGSIELIGTDISPAMLQLAHEHGETVLSPDDWRLLPKESFDGAIGVFVLHYGVPQRDLDRIAAQLRLGARFAANYFKPRPQAISVLVAILAESGLVLERDVLLRTTPSENRMLVFVKPGEAAQ